MKRLLKKLTRKVDGGVSRLVPGFLFNPNFVILGSPRSGSNLLVELLNSHSSICCHAELYSEKGAYSVEKHCFCANDSKRLLWLRDRFPRVFLKWIWLKPRKGQTVGFKIFSYQASRVLRLVLDRVATKKIILYRKNFLRSELSHQIACMTDEWQRKESATKKRTVNFDLASFHRRFAEVRKHEREWEEHMIATGQDFIKISYESISGESRAEELNRVFDFLELPRIDVRSIQTKLKKQNPYGLKELVTNFEEVEASLSGTDCEWMLADE